MADFRGNGLILSASCSELSEPSVAGPLPQRQLYGRKRGRPLRSGQQILVKTLLPRLAIDLPLSAGIDPAGLFPDAPSSIWLEIGFGAGEHLALQAAAHRDIGFIGSEVFENGIAKLLGGVERLQLANIRLFTDDARRLMVALPSATIGRVFILFPDPWPKVRHHKRRIVSTETLDQLARIMADDAELRLATDHPGYFAWMLERITNHPAFEWLARRPADWRRRPCGWSPTRYEEKAHAAGRSAWFLRARRIQRSGPHWEAATGTEF
jgi:tRNA (guanine-N7-)-methyltransferase